MMIKHTTAQEKNRGASKSTMRIPSSPTRSTDCRMISVYFLSLATLAIILTFSIQQNDATSLGKYKSSRDRGCYYMLQHFRNGEQIKTDEPCLNCTCENSMLMCYLRVCPYVKPVGDRCIIERVPNECCPKITCSDVGPNFETIEQELEPAPMTTTTSTTTLPTTSTTSASAASNYDVAFTNASEVRSGAAGCVLNNKYYHEGAQMPSDPSKPCEVCYCIRNSSACVMQDCALDVGGCTPIYQTGGCCPTRYNCSAINAFTTLRPQLGLKTPDSTSRRRFWESDSVSKLLSLPTPQDQLTKISTTTMKPIAFPDFGRTTKLPPPGCKAPNSTRTYIDGERIPSRNRCEHCYCMRNEIVCAVQECRPPCDGCVPIIDSDDQCCPKRYECAAPTQRVPTDNLIDIQDATTPSTIMSNNGENSSQSTVATSSSSMNSEQFIGGPVVAESESGSTIATATSKQNKDINLATQVGLVETPKSDVSVMTTRQTKPPLRPISPKLSMNEEDNSNEMNPEQGSSKSTKIETQESPTSASNVDGFNLQGEREQENDQKASGRFVGPEGSQPIGSNQGQDVNEPIPPGITSTMAPRSLESAQSPEKLATEQPAKLDAQNDVLNSSNQEKKTRPSVVPSSVPGEGSCRYNGRMYQNGQEVKSKDNCMEICMCINSVVYCDEVDCPKSPENQDKCQRVQSEGECCPKFICPDEIRTTITIESSPTSSEPSAEPAADDMASVSSATDSSMGTTPGLIDMSSPGTAAPSVTNEVSSSNTNESIDKVNLAGTSTEVADATTTTTTTAAPTELTSSSSESQTDASSGGPSSPDGSSSQGSTPESVPLSESAASSSTTSPVGAPELISVTSESPTSASSESPLSSDAFSPQGSIAESVSPSTISPVSETASPISDADPTSTTVSDRAQSQPETSVANEIGRSPESIVPTTVVSSTLSPQDQTSPVVDPVTTMTSDKPAPEMNQAPMVTVVKESASDQLEAKSQTLPEINAMSATGTESQSSVPPVTTTVVLDTAPRESVADDMGSISSSTESSMESTPVPMDMSSPSTVAPSVTNEVSSSSTNGAVDRVNLAGTFTEVADATTTTTTTEAPTELTSFSSESPTSASSGVSSSPESSSLSEGSSHGSRKESTTGSVSLSESAASSSTTSPVGAPELVSLTSESPTNASSESPLSSEGSSSQGSREEPTPESVSPTESAASSPTISPVSETAIPISAADPTSTTVSDRAQSQPETSVANEIGRSPESIVPTTVVSSTLSPQDQTSPVVDPVTTMTSDKPAPEINQTPMVTVVKESASDQLEAKSQTLPILNAIPKEPAAGDMGSISSATESSMESTPVPMDMSSPSTAAPQVTNEVSSSNTNESIDKVNLASTSTEFADATITTTTTAAPTELAASSSVSPTSASSEGPSSSDGSSSQGSTPESISLSEIAASSSTTSPVGAPELISVTSESPTSASSEGPLSFDGFSLKGSTSESVSSSTISPVSETASPISDADPTSTTVSDRAQSQPETSVANEIGRSPESIVPTTVVSSTLSPQDQTSPVVDPVTTMTSDKPAPEMNQTPMVTVIKESASDQLEAKSQTLPEINAMSATGTESQSSVPPVTTTVVSDTAPRESVADDMGSISSSTESSMESTPVPMDMSSPGTAAPSVTNEVSSSSTNGAVDRVNLAGTSTEVADATTTTTTTAAPTELTSFSSESQTDASSDGPSSQGSTAESVSSSAISPVSETASSISDADPTSTTVSDRAQSQPETSVANEIGRSPESIVPTTVVSSTLSPQDQTSPVVDPVTTMTSDKPAPEMNQAPMVTVVKESASDQLEAKSQTLPILNAIPKEPAAGDMGSVSSATDSSMGTTPGLIDMSSPGTAAPSVTNEVSSSNTNELIDKVNLAGTSTEVADATKTTTTTAAPTELTSSSSESPTSASSEGPLSFDGFSPQGSTSESVSSSTISPVSETASPISDADPTSTTVSDRAQSQPETSVANEIGRSPESIVPTTVVSSTLSPQDQTSPVVDPVTTMTSDKPAPEMNQTPMVTVIKESASDQLEAKSQTLPEINAMSATGTESQSSVPPVTTTVVSDTAPRESVADDMGSISSSTESSMESTPVPMDMSSPGTAAPSVTNEVSSSSTSGAVDRVNLAGTFTEVADATTTTTTTEAPTELTSFSSQSPTDASSDGPSSSEGPSSFDRSSPQGSTPESVLSSQSAASLPTISPLSAPELVSSSSELPTSALSEGPSSSDGLPPQASTPESVSLSESATSSSTTSPVGAPELISVTSESPTSASSESPLSSDTFSPQGSIAESVSPSTISPVSETASPISDADPTSTTVSDRAQSQPETSVANEIGRSPESIVPTTVVSSTLSPQDQTSPVVDPVTTMTSDKPAPEINQTPMVTVVKESASDQLEAKSQTLPILNAIPKEPAADDMGSISSATESSMESTPVPMDMSSPGTAAPQVTNEVSLSNTNESIDKVNLAGTFTEVADATITTTTTAAPTELTSSSSESPTDASSDGPSSQGSTAESVSSSAISPVSETASPISDADPTSTTVSDRAQSQPETSVANEIGRSPESIVPTTVVSSTLSPQDQTSPVVDPVSTIAPLTASSVTTSPADVFLASVVTANSTNFKPVDVTTVIPSIRGSAASITIPWSDIVNNSSSTAEQAISSQSVPSAINSTNFETKSYAYEPTQSSTMESDYEEISEDSGCEYEGKTYNSAQQIPRSHPCDFCFCFRGDIICLQQTCPPPVPHCFETVMDGFCCPRYECPVHTVRSSQNSTSLSLTPYDSHLKLHTHTHETGRPQPARGSSVRGCFVDNKLYGVGQVIESASGPCMECKCDKTGMMKCNPKECTPEDPLLQQINREVLQSTLSRTQAR